MTRETTAKAFVPGHVTAFFSVHRAADPVATGSRGAGLAIADGVEVEVALGEAAPDSAVTVNGEPVAPGPVAGVLDTLGVEATVRADTPLPPGTGFGVSGGLALGTALGANRAADLGRSSNDLVAVAHRAEVEAGTGLGDVVAQARGGVPIRLEPGAPPHGTLDGVPETTRLEYRTVGPIDTASVIGGDTSAVTAAGEAALAHLVERPTLPRLFAAGRTFAREAELIDPQVASIVEAVVDAGGEACMAMLGRTVVALDTGLTDAGYEAAASRVHQAGASLLAAPGEAGAE